jgi:short-subunit dehydrogenase
VNLKDKVVLITGAGSGIGKETAIEMARRGAIPVLIGRTESKLALAAEEAHRYRREAVIEVCDVAAEDMVQQMVGRVYERFQHIDVVINNAGIMNVKLFDDFTKDEFDEHLQINFYGALNLIRSVVPIMRKQGKGVILNVTSVGGKLIVPGTTGYAASKAALYAFSEALYFELADSGIHVGVVLPASIHTDILASTTTRLGEYYAKQCNVSPIGVAKAIKTAIEKERFETIVPLSSRFLLAFHDLFPGLFRKSILNRLRPYLKA